MTRLTVPVNSYSSTLELVITLENSITVLVATIDAQWEEMGNVGSARYEGFKLQ